MDLRRLEKPGDSPLLQIPVTIVSPHKKLRILATFGPNLVRQVMRRLLLITWLRPNGHNLAGMLSILHMAAHHHWPCVEFMLHSSELMPGGSRRFPTEETIEALFRDLTQLFDVAAHLFEGATLTEFHDHWKVKTVAGRPQ